MLKNCCDYDSIVQYESGALGSKYKTDLTGKLRETKLDTKLRENDINSFKDRVYKTYITLEPLVLYRLFGQYLSPEIATQGKDPKGAKLNGRYVSTEFAESIIDAKIRLAPLRLTNPRPPETVSRPYILTSADRLFFLIHRVSTRQKTNWANIW